MSERDELVEKVTKALAAADDKTFDPDCPSPCFPELARAAIEVCRDSYLTPEEEFRAKDVIAFALEGGAGGGPKNFKVKGDHFQAADRVLVGVEAPSVAGLFCLLWGSRRERGIMIAAVADE